MRKCYGCKRGFLPAVPQSPIWYWVKQSIYKIAPGQKIESVLSHAFLIGQYKMQTARLQTGYKMQTRYKMQTADWAQNADRE